MASEQPILLEANKDVPDQPSPYPDQLVWNPDTRTLDRSSQQPGVDAESALRLEAEDLGHATDGDVTDVTEDPIPQVPSRVVIDRSLVEEASCGDSPGSIHIGFLPHEGLYSSYIDDRYSQKVQGVVIPHGRSYLDEDLSEDVAVVLHVNQGVDESSADAPSVSWLARVRHGEGWVDAELELLDTQQELARPNHGVIGSDDLAGCHVVILGLGSVGGETAVRLVQSGVSRLTLIDYDRLEMSNIPRHACTLRDVGRMKTGCVADLCLQKNPQASVTTIDLKLEEATIDRFVEACSDADLIICAIDEVSGRLLAQRLAMDLQRTILFGGLFHRACGGQTLLWEPGSDSGCYGCFRTGLGMPAQGDDSASDVEYADRPVEIRPGLYNDIDVVVQHLVAQALNLLTRGSGSHLEATDEDFEAPWHLIYNRREPGHDSERLTAMSESVGAMTIGRWYGIHLKQVTGCAYCGDFDEAARDQYQVQTTDADRQSVLDAPALQAQY